MAGYAIVPDIDAPELTATDLAVWAALCRFADWEMEDGKLVKSKAGTCFPSLTGIQQKTRLGRSTICRSLQNLETLGYIVREQKQVGNAHGNTEYTLIPAGRGGSPTAGLGSPRAGRGLSHSGTTVVPQRDGGSPTAGHNHTHIPNPITKPSYQEAEGEPAAGGVTLTGVIQLWNDRLAAHLCFPMVQKETPARKKAFQARVNEAKERRSLTWWEAVIGKLAASEFMCASAREKAGWLNFDWLLNENNLVKVLEGRYDGRKTPWTRGRDSPQKAPPPATWEEAVKQYRQRHGFDRGGEDDAEAGFVKVS